MGLFSGVTNAIGSVFSKGVKAASEWGGKAVGIYTAAKSGNILGMIGQVGSALMEKRAGGSGDWAPVDTSSGISVPGTGTYTMGFKRAGSAESPNVRMKTVDADTLNAEWEYRLERGFRKKNLYS